MSHSANHPSGWLSHALSPSSTRLFLPLHLTEEQDGHRSVKPLDFSISLAPYQHPVTARLERLHLSHLDKPTMLPFSVRVN